MERSRHNRNFETNEIKIQTVRDMIIKLIKYGKTVEMCLGCFGGSFNV